MCACGTQEITVFRKADKVRKPVQSASTGKFSSPETATAAAKLTSPDVVPSSVVSPTSDALHTRSSPDGVASDPSAPKH